MRKQELRLNSVLRRAFTLIELLVVTSILGVVASAVMVCLVGGIRAWDSVRHFNSVEIKSLIGLEILEKDLVNSFEFDGIAFEGSETRMSFAALAFNSPDEGKAPVPGISTVVYEFDRTSGSLKRDIRSYPERESGAGFFEEVLVRGLTGAQFEYYYFTQDEAGKTDGGWQSGEVRGTNYIGGVRVMLEFQGDEGVTEIRRTIMLPVSQMVIE